jgi:elongation factor G
MLDAGYLPSPMDKEGIEGIHPDDAELLEEDQTNLCVSQMLKSHLLFKIATDPSWSFISSVLQDD